MFNLFRRLASRYDEEIVIPLGSEFQKGSIYAPIKTRNVWKRESLSKRIVSIIRLSWIATPKHIQDEARAIFVTDVFGTDSDYGKELMVLMAEHHSQKWELNHLTADDLVKADALEAMTILTRLRYEETSIYLRLQIKDRALHMCVLANAMVFKIPVVSFQYFLCIHPAFAFNSIRKSGHAHAHHVIQYLYEILNLQQKTAAALHEFVRLVDYAERRKRNALMINAEFTALMQADLIFAYLKASVEKIIVMTGYVMGVSNLDSKPTHKAKMNMLRQSIPEQYRSVFYVELMFEFFSSENLDELNSYRSGILHKRGIADLQPHNYVGKDVENVPFRKIFQVLRDQHAANTTVLLGALAILTDRLMVLDPPDFLKTK